MTNTRITPKSTGGGAQRRTPRLRRGWHTIALEATVTAAPEATITAAPEATITATPEVTVTAALEVPITVALEPTITVALEATIYGVNVVYEGDNVYVDGKREASAKEYSQQAITLANTSEEQPPAPMPPEDGKQAEYLPLGVWAMVQEEKGDAYMFFQISIDKNGVVTGAFKNLLSGEVSPVSGEVDKKTQRAAWKIGSNSSTVIETGLQNLTQEVASCLVHFGTDTTQTWLLVRLKNPDMSKTPESGPVADDSK